MKSQFWQNLYAWLLSAFFLLGGWLNIFADPELVEEYRHWGYPGWFHYVTGMAEWASAGLIAFSVTRFWGSVLGCAIMAAAAISVSLQAEYTHALMPLIILVLTAFNGWIAWRRHKTA
ncbi:DoxX family protein [Altericroceibacterium spongiae]|uniref:DoxX family protein n=2 Tax=Altericroceibacterium spongiae TaxID=2320269 RepID=A0A420EA97_9SPHN|nr:DoxX family protein [Altericroceibacterium spongiae]